ncbi:conserved hypothetical protein [Leishmania major strain Friedlin]|uniref:Uncharacterized protein n=1 Tax=Leishmania major TaxID=5664 RepID=E9AD30_LEIMA|nr:conserved hypothetical protein [Leishmania major strain Friedlin]CAG9576653.1 hypothetical_protein_-_conserved [Leishmania major strain Friedlin]CBZ12113.1 conserved hypothetical protein [Leishmania major strain Friedlin]|eukprot:XP_003721859.1 conserved hypothetical protein [Leishmania major strain Friedlin]
MQSSTVTAALQDALEKGDIVELEQAITAAEDAIHVSAYSRKTPSSPLGCLIARAKNMYLVHMNACKVYVEPLREACKELSERGIFEALVKARGAPDEVQLCMYTDLCNAESLRREIIEAQRLAVQLLDSTSAQEVDDFLTECSPFLEDRTILALVQKREDLIRETRRRTLGRATTTPQRAGAAKFMLNPSGRERNHRDPPECPRRFELEDDCVSPVTGRHARSAYCSSSGDGPTSYGRRAVCSEPSEEVASSSNSARAAYPAVCDALEKARDSGLERAIMEGASPWMQTVRALRQQAYEAVVCHEHNTRRHLEDAEEDGRAELYRSEMLSRVRRWTAAAEVFSAHHGEKKAAPKGDGEAGSTPRRPVLPLATVLPAPSPACPPSPPASRSQAATVAAADTVNQPLTRVHATNSLSAYAFHTGVRTLTPTRYSRAGAEATVEGAVLGNGVRHRVAEELHTPRLSRDTPNISPIKDMSTTSGAVSLSEQDPLYHRDNTKTEWGDALERGTPRGKVSGGSTSAAAGILAGSSTTTAMLPSLELRRIQARLRAVLQEEDIHRRDIEGTEDFDRSVFLFPVSARIALLRRTEAQRVRAF